jgi:hypothetical protein
MIMLVLLHVCTDLSIINNYLLLLQQQNVFSLNTKHLQGTVGVNCSLVCKAPLLSLDEHINVTDDDKSAGVLYIQCVAKPSLSQEHTLLWQSTYLPAWL